MSAPDTYLATLCFLLADDLERLEESELRKRRRALEEAALLEMLGEALTSPTPPECYHAPLTRRRVLP
ncbi:MAG: hypothetical protein ACYTG6_04170 [Planctomycetota bacterium]|jgi:hypothetical protein